jgi:oligoribonuclease (3'-5' exoribonuclease)
VCYGNLQVLTFVQEHTEYGQAQLAGNSVHVDRVFLQRYMPQLVDHLHYRIVDVSTLKELCRCAARSQLIEKFNKPVTEKMQYVTQG